MFAKLTKYSTFSFVAIASLALFACPHRAVQAQGVNLAQLAAEVQSLQSQVTSLQSTVNSQASTIQSLQSTVNSQAGTIQSLQGTVSGLQGTVSGLQGTVSGLQTTVTNQGKITGLFSLQNGIGTNTELTLSGVNLHIVNGEGSTRTDNGLGNLIVGYNETRGNDLDVRTGSHNIVTGVYNNYSADGGIIGGYENSLSGVEEFCVGEGNTVSLDQSCISGGAQNTASSPYASVSGGYENMASGEVASVSGGLYNTSSGMYASVSGGQQNTASGNQSSVSGGGTGTASGLYASTSGGLYNTASGEAASVSGGFGLSANGSYIYNSSTNTWAWDAVGPTWAATTYSGH